MADQLPKNVATLGAFALLRLGESGDEAGVAKVLEESDKETLLLGLIGVAKVLTQTVAICTQRDTLAVLDAAILSTMEQVMKL